MINFGLLMSELESQPGKSSFLVWDVEDPPPVGEWTTILWSSFGDSGFSNQISMPTLVEEQADILKNRYLEWVYDLGELQINGKRLIDHLELRPGFSFWWMTSIVQKFNASGISPIGNAIKALALEDLVSEYKPDSILLVSGNTRIASMLQSFCRNSNLKFHWNRERDVEKQEITARSIYRNLPYILQANIFFMRYLINAITLVSRKYTASRNMDGEICFVDVLVHLDRRAILTGQFISNYWTILVDKLSLSNIRCSWLHNYYCQESIPSLKNASDLLGCFNSHSNKMQSHSLIEEKIDLSVMFKALRDYYKLYKASFRLNTIKCNFKPSDSAMDLWPLFQQEWNESLLGQSALLNSLRLSLYEKIFKSIPYHKTGIYIMENQPWEMALIHGWRSAGHGRLIGIPHTAVRYWDLRYFYDARSYNDNGKNILPKPNLVAVNGPVAMNMYLDWGYPKLQIKKVEALRFLHLLNFTTANSSIKSQVGALKVLICGDFLPITNYKILSWLEIANQYLSEDYSYILKPHPGCSINLSNFASLSLKITDANLEELFTKCDLVFTSNSTAAAVDAYYSGIPVIQMLDGENLNMSPLRNVNGVLYVKNPIELATAIRNSQQTERIGTCSYFYLDTNLPRWQKLLNIDLTDTKD